MAQHFVTVDSVTKKFPDPVLEQLAVDLPPGGGASSWGELDEIPARVAAIGAAADDAAARAAIGAGTSNLTVDDIEGLTDTAIATDAGISIPKIANLVAELNARAQITHSHSIADVANLAVVLDGKADVGLAIAGVLEWDQMPPSNAPVGSLWARPSGEDEPTPDPDPEVTLTRVGGNGYSNNSATLNIGWPAGTAAGDLAICIHAHNHSGPTADYSDMPAGWTGIASLSPTDASRTEVYARVLTSGDIAAGQLSIDEKGSEKASGSVEIWRCNAAITASAVTASIDYTSAAASTRVAPTIAISGDVRALVAYGERSSSTTTTAPSQPSGYNLAQFTGTTGGGATCLATAWHPSVQSGEVVGGGTWTLAAAAGNAYTTTIAIAIPS